jgi:hypothetical protein
MGRATDLLQMPTRMLMAGGAKRRRNVIAIVAALLVAGGIGTAGAVFALDSAKVGTLHKEWGAFQGCMLGEPLKPGETPAARYRLLLLAQTATPMEKRPVSKGQAWPASCLSSLAVVSDNATRAPAAGAELEKAIAAVAKALTTNTLPESPKKLDEMWNAAAASKLTDRAGAADPSTPKPVTPLFARAAFEGQPKPFGDFALAAVRGEVSPSARLRFLVDDRSTDAGPLLCRDQAGVPAALTCKALGPDVAKLSPGVRLLGMTVDAGGMPLLFAGERGRGGVFRDLATPVIQGPTVLGATALDGGRVRVLAKKDEKLVLAENGGKDRPTETVVRGLTDGALVADYLVSRSPTNHLIVQRVGVTDPAIDVGELAEPLANDKDWSDDRAALCRVPGTEALRLRGAQSDFVSVNVGGHWSAPQKLARTEQLSCADGIAVLATTTHKETSGRTHATVTIQRCTASGCRETRLSHYDMVSGIPELMPISRTGFATTVSGNRMYFAWFTSLGDLRVRTGTIDAVATAPDVVVYEGSEAGAPAQTRDVALVPSTQGAGLLVRTADGVRVFTIDTDGVLTPAVTKL